jgi:hypothetical protein
MSTPSVPLIVVRPRATNQSLEFYWAPPSSDGGSAITGYVLADAGHSLSYNLGASTYYHQVTGLTNGETYSFTLAATNGNGTGPTAAFRSVQPGNKPTPPTNVTASLGTSTAIVNWALPTNNSGASLIRNLVEAVPVDEAGAEQRTSTIYGTTYGNGTARFVSPLGSYTYKIYVHSINDPGWSARSQGITLANGAFAPNDISGSLALWVDMADTTTYDVSGLYIPYIRDKSFSTVTFKAVPGTGGTGHDFIAGFDIAGDTNQSLRISADGENWGIVDGQQNPTGNKCPGVKTVKYNGSNLWMVGGNFTDNTACIETSSNGYDWSTVTQAFTGATSFVRGLVHANDRKWIAGGQNAGDPPSTLQYSLDDGSNWTLAGCGINYVTDIAWNGDSTFVAVGYDFSAANEGQFATSADGITWTAAQYTPEYARFYPLVVKYLGGNWYMGGVDATDGTSNLWTSPDGSNWSTINHGVMITQTIAYNGSNLYMIGGNSYANHTNTIRYSSDGGTWTSWNTQNYMLICQGLAYANGKWVAAGYSTYDYLGAKLGVYAYSYDGSNWAPMPGAGTGVCIEASSSNANITTPSSFAEFPHIGSTINGKATAGFTKAATITQQFTAAEGAFDVRTGNFGSLFWVGRQSTETPYQSLFGTTYNYDWNTRSNFYISNVTFADNLLAAPNANPVYMYRNESTIKYSKYSNVDVAPADSVYMTTATGFVYPQPAFGWDKLGLYTRLQGLAFESAVWDRGWTGDMAEIIALKEQTPAPLAQKVEGYLAWKWGLVDSLPSNHPYKNAAPGNVSPQGPTRLSNSWAALRNGNSLPMFWYDAQDPTTVNVDENSNVIFWGDKSGLGATLIPLTPGDPNGSITYDGYGVYFSTTSTNSMVGYAPPGPVPQTFTSNSTDFLVCTPSANSATTSYLTGRSGAPGGSPAWIINLYGEVSTISFFASGLHIDAPVQTSTLLVSAKLEQYGQVSQYLNGSTIATSSIGALDDGTQYRNYEINPSGAFDGYVYEWLQYPFALTKPEREYVEGHLAWKWNFASNLPAGHPYKTAAPTLPPSWSSNSLESATLRLWLDASDPFANGVPPAYASTITTWYDKSGSGNHAGAEAAVSTFCSTVLTPYLQMRSSNAFLLSNASTYLHSTPFTAFFVESHEDVFDYPYNASNYPDRKFYSLLSTRPSATATEELNLAYQIYDSNAATTKGPWAHKNGDSNTPLILNLQTHYNNTPKVTSLSFGSGGKYYFNTTVGSNFLSNTTSAYGTRTSEYYNAINDISDAFLCTAFQKTGSYNGKFHEVRIYTGDMTQTEVQAIQSELTQKWGARGSSNTTIAATNTLSNIKGISLWLDATDPLANGVPPPHGSSIGVWRDKSGEGRDAICVTPDYPKYETLSNDRWIRFRGNATPEALVISTIAFFNSTPVTYFFADTYEGGTASNLGTRVFGSVNVDGNSFTTLYNSGSNAGNGPPLSLNTTAAGNTLSALSEFIEPGHTHVWTISKTNNIDGAYSSRMFENGKLVGSNTSNTLQIIDDSNVFSIGGAYNAGSNVISMSYNGKLRELIAIEGNVDDATRQQVEQYLTAKWLPPLYATSPLDVSGLRVWLDGADPDGTGTLPANGSLVTTWVDKSGLGNSFTGASKPIFRNLGANKYVEFIDLSSTKLSLTNPSFVNGKYFNIFVVEEYEGIKDFASPFGGSWFLGNDTGELRIGYYTYPGPPPEGLLAPVAIYSFDLNTSALIANGPIKKVRRVWIFQFAPYQANTTPGDTMRSWMYEGNQGARTNTPNSYQTTTQGTPLGAISNLSLGAGYWTSYTSTQYYNGKIFEVLFYEGQMAGDDRIKIKNYLLRKWKLYNANVAETGPIAY